MPKGIEAVLLSAVVEGRIRPGNRLSENQLAEAFGVSRTLVREALARLEARNIVLVKPRKGWFVVEPSAVEAAEVYATRRIVEFGFLMTAAPFTALQIATLQRHIDEERAAIDEGDKPRLTYLMGDFHVRIVEQSGNATLVETMRTLAARTNLISLRYQSDHNALASHEDHLRIFDAITRGDMKAAAQLSFEHLEDVEAGIMIDTSPNAIDLLKNTLRLDEAPNGRTTSRASHRLHEGTTDDHET